VYEVNHISAPTNQIFLLDWQGLPVDIPRSHKGNAMAAITAITPHTIQKFGWIPDLPDFRDHLYSAPQATMSALPPKVDLQAQCPAVYDQGQLGSCTGNAIAGAIQFDRKKQSLSPDFIPSRLFIYFNERVIEHTVSTDSGAMIRDGIKSVAKLGGWHEAVL
jgi:C1A family cysteine protease